MTNTMSRRNFIRAGGTVAGGLILAGLIPNQAGAAVPTYLPVDTDSLRLFQDPVPLASTTVMQSFAIDNINGYIYTAQLLASSPADSGDITLTKLNLADGSKEDPIWIHLRGFGHATQIGVEPVDAMHGGGAMIWIETSVESSTNVSPYGGAVGYGTKIARLHMGGTTGFQQNDDVHALTADNNPNGPYYEVFDPRPDYGQKSIAVDIVSSTVSLRYHTAAHTFVHELFDLGDFTNHQYTALYKTTLDYSVFSGQYADTANPAFQGHTTFGNYFYILTGAANTDNVRLWSFNWANATNPAPHDVALSEAGTGFAYHEPEGMSVILKNTPSDYRLMFGIATGDVGSREAMFYYKNSN